MLTAFKTHTLAYTHSHTRFFWPINIVLSLILIYMCVLLCTIATTTTTTNNNKFCVHKNDRTAQSRAQPSRIPKQRQQQQKQQLNVKATPTATPTPRPASATVSDAAKPSLLPKPKVRVVIPPALQQRLRQQQQQQQSQPEEPSIQEEYDEEFGGAQPTTPTGASSRIPVRTLKAERRALAAAARQAGLSLDEYMRQLEEQEQEPSTPTTPTGKSRAMLK